MIFLFKNTENMRSIKELAPKPSDALQCLVNGSRTELTFDNLSFLEMDKNHVFFLLFTLQEITGIDIFSSDISTPETRAKTFDVDVNELITFEKAIDCIRLGQPVQLMKFYNVKDYPKPLQNFWNLSCKEFKTELTKVESYIGLLKARDL